MRLHLIRAAAALLLVGAGGCAFEPRYPIEPGVAPGRGVVVDQPAYPIDPPPAAQRSAFDAAGPDAPALVSAVDYGDAAELWTLASTRHPALRRKLDSDSDADSAPRKSHRRGRGAKAGAEDDGAQGGATVTVKAGDTLYSLAGRNHATVEAVARLNGLKPPYALAPGRTLKLPTPRTYVAKKGDTVSAVADRYGVKESLVRKANPDIAGDALKRGAKLVLPAAAKDAGSDDHAQGAAPAASTEAAAPDAQACPKRRGRKACLATAAKAARTAAESAAPTAEAAAFDLKACRRRHTRRACAAQAKAAETPGASPKAQAVAAFDLKACRRRHTRRACAAQAKAAEASAVQTAAASSRKATAEVADAEQVLKDCRRHHRRRACAAESRALTEAKAASTPAALPADRKTAADAATAALNLKACLRRHSRRACAAQSAAAQSAAAREPAQGSAPSPSRAAAANEPEVSAESMVASLPPVATTSSTRTRTRLTAPATTPPPAESTLPTSASGRETASLPTGVSPGPRPYASVFGSGESAPAATGRRTRDRSGRTSEDAQAAAAAAARRDYARASLTAPPLAGATDGSGKPRFAWPVSGEVISGFGPKGAGLRNDGVDLAASVGDPVRASAAGEVVYAGGAIPGFGNLVLVKHAGGYVTAYGHLSKISVAMRQAVRQGEVVGEAGQSGAVTRPELHFEIRYAASPEENAKPVDPAPLLPKRG